MEELKISTLYRESERSIAFPYLKNYTYPWEVLSSIKSIIGEIGKTLSREEFDEISPEVWVAKSACIAPTACIEPPCIICEDAQVRHGAFIRGAAIVGRGAVVGNSVELKNCILFDGVEVPHFNYVGDSILGYKAHMGAGAVTSNVKSDRSYIAVHCNGKTVETGCRKFGAMLGDHVEVGCNSVLNPGTVIGRYTNVYPLSSVRGYVPTESIYKSQNSIVKKR
ncbi:MAG: UDP-N-acetylglucosamine pyrophosphorylase [Clostridia bacterium]|nr:UDP-N-acetylglucosamine pyrophosphorylase [Clostridia bacterium]